MGGGRADKGKKERVPARGKRARRLRGDRSYEITAAAEQTSFAEFGQDFNRSGATGVRVVATRAGSDYRDRIARHYLMAASLSRA